MKIDIYRKYDFKYDEKRFMKNLKNELINKGYRSLSLFHDFLNQLGIHSYETARSYYNMRRVVPIDLLIKICNKLDLNVNDIMFPNSALDPTFEKDIANHWNSYYETFNTFDSVFNLYDIDSNLEIDYDDLEFNISQSSLILAKYNYLLQKYYFADLCNDELNDLGNFSINFLVDRVTHDKFDWQEFRAWKKELKSDDFLHDFYAKYTLVLNNVEFSELLIMLKKRLPDYLFEKINNLLPECDRL